MANTDRSSSHQHFVLTNDCSIRVALLHQLEQSCAGEVNTRVIEELGITHGIARVDIAVVNGIIHGYELKSDVDTLERLPNQIKVYNSVLDRVTLVVGKKHLHDAFKIVPDWWGVSVAKFSAPGDIEFLHIRDAKQNPAQDPFSIACLLWRDEALSILEEMECAHGVRSKNRKEIYERLCEKLSIEDLKNRVRKTLLAREGWLTAR